MGNLPDTLCAADIDADIHNGEFYHDDWIKIANAKRNIFKKPRVISPETLAKVEASRKRIAEWGREHYAKTCTDFDQQLVEARIKMVQDCAGLTREEALERINKLYEVKTMGRLDKKPEDYEKAREQGEEAATSGSMFLNKRMPGDHDKVYVVFLEIPQFGPVTYKDSKPKEKGQANVLSFGNDGSQCEEEVFILELAPKHHNVFIDMLMKPKYGLAKLYEIERFGVPNFTGTRYALDEVRDLTPEEVAYAEQVELHELFKPKDGDTAAAPTPPTGPAPPPAGDTTGNAYVQWNKQVVHEMKLLEWAGEDMKQAIKVFFGEYINGGDMGTSQRDKFLEALRKVNKGGVPADIGVYGDVEVRDTLNLDEDVDFF